MFNKITPNLTGYLIPTPGKIFGNEKIFEDNDLLEEVRLNDGTRIKVVKGVVTEYNIRKEGDIHNIIVHLRFEESSLTPKNLITINQFLIGNKDQKQQF